MQTLSHPASLRELHLSQRRLQPYSSLTRVREKAPGNCRSQGMVCHSCADHGRAWQGQCSEFLSNKQKQVYHLMVALSWLEGNMPKEVLGSH